MKKPIVLIAAIVAVVGLCAAVAVAKDTTKVRTSVSIRGGHYSGQAFGHVRALKGCEKFRKVSLHLEGFGGAVRSVSSNKRGEYFIDSELTPQVPRYWVVVERKVIRKNRETIVCERGRSKTRGHAGAVVLGGDA